MSTTVSLKPIQQTRIKFRIRGLSPLITHAWDAKAAAEMLAKKQGKKTKTRGVCDPESECEAATYRTEAGEPGIPLTALKKSLIGAAHKDLGISKELVKKALYIESDDPNGILRIESESHRMRQDYVRVGQGTDLRFRPEFTGWTVIVSAIIDAEMLRLEDLTTLINRAGFGVGICEWRPQKEGDFGRFEIDPTFPIEEERLS